MKKVLALALVLAALLLCAAPALAAAAEPELSPQGSAIIRGGLVYESSGKYILYGEADGAVEWKTVTASLYRVSSGGSLTYIDSVSATDVADLVVAEKTVSITQSGNYRVIVYAATRNTSGSLPYNYVI